MDNIPFCDLHCDTAMELLTGSNLMNSNLQVNIPLMKNSGIGLQLFACYVSSNFPEHKRKQLIIQMLDKILDQIELNSDEMMLCINYKSAYQALNSNKIGVVLTVENGIAIENDINNLVEFYNKGVRCLTIVHAQTHDWAISSNDSAPKFDGLTDFGRQVIAAMNEMGMIIDVSHAHDIAVEKILKITKRPIIASHSCANAICDASRNLKDDIIKGIADSGGMVGINFFNGFLDSEYNRILMTKTNDLFDELSKMENKAGDDIFKINKYFHKFKSKYLNVMADISVPVDRIIDHIDYIINLVGDDYVGFGSDFDGMPHAPSGVENCSGFNLIHAKLIEKGYSNNTIEKICYKNFVRIFKSHQF